MSCTVSLETVFSEFYWCTSPPALCNAAMASKGNSKKQLTKPTVQFILSLSIYFAMKMDNMEWQTTVVIL